MRGGEVVLNQARRWAAYLSTFFPPGGTLAEGTERSPPACAEDSRPTRCHPKNGKCGPKSRNEVAFLAPGAASSARTAAARGLQGLQVSTTDCKNRGSRGSRQKQGVQTWSWTLFCGWPQPRRLPPFVGLQFHTRPVLTVYGLLVCMQMHAGPSGPISSRSRVVYRYRSRYTLLVCMQMQAGPSPPQGPLVRARPRAWCTATGPGTRARRCARAAHPVHTHRRRPISRMYRHVGPDIR